MQSSNAWLTHETESLFRAILQLETTKDAQNFFRDLLTEQEIIEFGKRWKVAQMLAQNIPYTRIEKETGMSSKTIARIQKWLTGGMGGYKKALYKVTK